MGGEDLVGRWVARTSSRSCEDVNYLYQRNGRWRGGGEGGGPVEVKALNRAAR